MSSLRRRFDPTRVLFEPLDAEARLDGLRDIPGVQSMQQREGEAELKLFPGTDPSGVIRAAAAVVVPARIEIARVRLEDVFVGMVRSEAGGNESEAALREHLQGLSGEKA
jgi:ABC-type uncharacterized transport system ATPase subunit